MYCVLYTTTVYMLYCMALKVQLFFFYKIIDMIIKSPNKKHAAAPCWSLVTGTFSSPWTNRPVSYLKDESVLQSREHFLSAGVRKRQRVRTI